MPLRLDFVNNQFVGQLAILDTLKDQQKFRTDTDTDTFRNEFETFIFRTQEATWRSLMEATARQADWYLVPPGGHETMKTRAFTLDVWRDDGGDYVNGGTHDQLKAIFGWRSNQQADIYVREANRRRLGDGAPDLLSPPTHTAPPADTAESA